MISPEGPQHDGEKAVAQLGSSQESEQHPPVTEEQIELLVPDIGRQDTSQTDFSYSPSSTPGMLDTISSSGEGLNNNI